MKQKNTWGKSNSVSVAVEEMTTNLTAVAAAMEHSAINATMVAAATEEMSTTITENASNSMATLGKAAKEISQVTETITEISEQTYLL